MTRGRQPVFYGWWVALTAALGLFFGVAPIFVFSFSVFLKAFTGEFHATRAAVSLAFTLHNLVSASAAPFAGRFIDRFGSRRVIRFLPKTPFVHVWRCRSSFDNPKAFEIPCEPV